MKPREPRRKVMIRARMRIGARWMDVCILNMSRRGLGLQAASAPQRGTYVEVRRGRHVMIGCVAWSKGHRFGLATQDCLAIDAIIREPDLSTTETGGAVAPPPPPERRAAPRPGLERHESSRLLSRALEFGFLLVLALSAAAVAFQSVEQALAAPMAEVSGALRPPP